MHVHGVDFSHPKQLIRRQKALLLSFLGDPSTQERQMHGVEERLVTWKAPLFGRYKVNWDVALDNINKCLRVSIIVRTINVFLMQQRVKLFVVCTLQLWRE